MGLWDSLLVEVRNSRAERLALQGDQAYRTRCHSRGRCKLAGPGPDRLRERALGGIGFGKS